MSSDIAEHIELVAEGEASLSGGSLRLYAIPFGCVDLYNYDPINRRCAVGIMVTTNYRRQGYALAMLRQLATLASTSYRLRTIYADIAVTNVASIGLFSKAGYTECGHFRDWLYMDGKFIDSIRMQLIL